MTTLASAFVAAQKAMKHPKLAGDNPHFRSKFVPRDEAIDCIVPVCNEHGIAVIQSPVTVDGMVGVITKLLHESGESWEFGPFLVSPTKQDPQGQMAAVTYASRGALMAVFARAGDGDDDGTTASQKPAQEASQKPTEASSDAIGSDDKRIKVIYGKGYALGMKKAEIEAGLKKSFGVDHAGDLTEEQLKKCLDNLEKRIVAKEKAESESVDKEAEELGFEKQSETFTPPAPDDEEIPF